MDMIIKGLYAIECDGSHFNAIAREGPIEGCGTFRQEGPGAKGLINGSITSGPDVFLNLKIEIHVIDNDGIGYMS